MIELPDNKLVKGAIWFFGICGALVVGTYNALTFADNRWQPKFDPNLYQKAADATQQLAANDRKFDELNIQVRYSADQLLKRSIENDLFKLEQIPAQKLTPADHALYEKLKRERRELVDHWNRMGRPLR